MKVIFDTSIFLALFVDKEKYHEQAIKKYQEYKQQHTIFLTSDYILDEFFTRLTYDFGKAVTQKTIRDLQKIIDQGELRVLRIDGVIFKKAIDVMIKFSEHKVSFTDATTFVLYKDLKIDEIFTLDNDFRKMRAVISPNIDQLA